MTEQLFQIGVKGLIRNKKGEILLVHLPQLREYPAMWDFPGGRMEPGETFLQTLKRELQEELSVTYNGTPRQLITVETNFPVSVGDMCYPLNLVVYEVELPADATIQLDPNSREDGYVWAASEDAADKLSVKFAPEMCDYVRTLSSPLESR